ncbi:hypothetical protein ACIA6C_02175 [Streptomyces sp. NPDC051578]|uniref:hypothetical protein n=1 Tax=Streptomyces sp. NPDC051578 TaxID=3365662 RepID=UPI0037A9ED7E
MSDDREHRAAGSAGAETWFAMCAVLVLDPSIRTAQPCGTISWMLPEPQRASTVTSPCTQTASVKSITMPSILHSATILRGTVHRPCCLMLLIPVLRTSVSASVPGRAPEACHCGKSATSTSSSPYVFAA